MKTETKPTETAGNASVSAIVADNGSFPVPTPNAAKTLIECLEALAETAPDNRSPYTCREIAAALEEQFSVGYRAGIAEILHFYKRTYPDETKAILQLMEIAGRLTKSTAEN